MLSEHPPTTPICCACWSCCSFLGLVPDQQNEIPGGARPRYAFLQHVPSGCCVCSSLKQPSWVVYTDHPALAVSCAGGRQPPWGPKWWPPLFHAAVQKAWISCKEPTLRRHSRYEMHGKFPWVPFNHRCNFGEGKCNVPNSCIFLLYEILVWALKGGG